MNRCSYLAREAASGVGWGGGGEGRGGGREGRGDDVMILPPYRHEAMQAVWQHAA